MDEVVLLVFSEILKSFLYVMDFAFLLRVVFSFMDPMQEMGISRFLYAITEPLILPMRKLCERMNWFTDSPLDVPFFLTALIMMLLISVL